MTVLTALSFMLFTLIGCVGEEDHSFIITQQKKHCFSPDGGCDTVFTNKAGHIFGLFDSLLIRSHYNDENLANKYTYNGGWYKVEINPSYNPKAVITTLQPNLSGQIREFNIIIGFGDDYFGDYPFKSTNLYYYQPPKQ